MEMPRAFSSLRRSVSTPVNARTSVVLPWSMWPAVPTIIGLSARNGARSLRASQQSQPQPAPLRRESLLVGGLEATQIEPQGLGGGAADHRAGQGAQCRFQAIETAAAGLDRPDHQA